MTFTETVEFITTTATAAGVLLTAWQLYAARRQALTAFEDSLSREYRDLARDLPVDALLGQAVPLEKLDEARSAFFRYFDLCNEQAFLRQMKRVSRVTWDDWLAGIRTNIRRPAFAAAWADFKSKSRGSLQELMRLEEEGFVTDPARWDERADAEVRDSKLE